MIDPATHRKGLLITLLGVLVLVPDTLIIRLIEAEQEVDPFSITLWRGSLLFVGLMVIYLAAEGRGAMGRAFRLGRWGLITAAFMSLQNLCFVIALTYTTVANTLLIIATAPLFAALFSWMFLGERAPLRTWLAILASILGIAIIFSGSLEGAGTIIGDVPALGTAIRLGASFTAMRHMKDANMIPASALGGMISAILVLPIASPFVFTSHAFALMLLLGLIVLPVSFALITLGPRYIPAPEVSLLLLLETVLAPIVVWYVLDEKPSVLALGGGAIVVSALFLHALAGLRRSR